MGDVLLDSTLQWNRDKPWGACVGGSSHKRTSCVTTLAHAALGATFFLFFAVMVWTYLREENTRSWL